MPVLKDPLKAAFNPYDKGSQGSQGSQEKGNLPAESKGGAAAQATSAQGPADPAHASSLFSGYANEQTRFAGGNPKGPDDMEEWKTVEGSLYDGSMGAPQTSDIEQGGDGASGTCWLLSTLGAYAHAGIPGQLTLQDMITPLKDGTFNVKLYNPEMEGTNFKYRMLPGATIENVAPSFPVDMAGWLSTDPNPRDKTALWAAVIEKAVAQKMGGDYRNVFGNAPELAMALVSGKLPTEVKNWNEKDPNNPQGGNSTLSEQDAFKIISKAQKTNSPMVAGTIGNGFDHKLGENKNLDGQHAYSVLGTVERSGQIYVQLYNPFGFADSDDTLVEQKKAKNPYMEVTLTDFVKTFKHLTVGEAMGKDLDKCVEGPTKGPNIDRDYAAGDVVCKT